MQSLFERRGWFFLLIFGCSWRFLKTVLNRKKEEKLSDDMVCVCVHCGGGCFTVYLHNIKTNVKITLASYNGVDNVSKEN